MQVTDTLLETFRTAVEKMVDDHYRSNFPVLRETSQPLVSLEVGKKYVRVVRSDKHLSTGKVTGRCVYCFVNQENGDILKAAGWKAPAKHARGSVHNAEILKGCTPYGPVYL